MSPDFRHSQVTVGDSSLHVVEAGDPGGEPVLFLHGWPQNWSAWRGVMSLAVAAARPVRAIAVDLPGVGASTGDATDGTKRQLAARVHGLVQALHLEDFTLVGQDVGGTIVYSYLREYPDVRAAVLLDVAMPGVDPWDEMVRNPYLFHIALHSIPELPEQLVQGRQRTYFNFFFDVLSGDPSAITPAARDEYAAAYADASALTASFNWYRAFGRDAVDAKHEITVATPTLYLRGEKGGRRIAEFAAGFTRSGLTALTHDLIPQAGHFAHEEAPGEVWQRIAHFAGL